MRDRPKKAMSKALSRAKKTKRGGKVEESPPSFDLELYEADSALLDEFCKEFGQFDEIPYESWEYAHKSLDIQVPFWVDPEAITQKSIIKVKFTRRVLSSSESGILKEAVEIDLNLPLGTHHGDQLTLPGLGDRQDLQCGNLIVTIYLRKPPPN